MYADALGCALKHDMTTKTVNRCSGMSTDAVGCSDAWPDDKGCYHMQWDVYGCC